MVSIDVEAFERNQLKVTEIGIAVYDPENQWLLSIPQVKTLHILTKENLHLHNGSFVADRKYFFNGGKSYTLSTPDLRMLVEQILNHYLDTRSGILVGHDVGGDVRWLKRLGIKIPENIQSFDTFKVYLLTTKKNGSLKKILRRLNIPHANLHNAANDAYYTLLAALSLSDPNQRVYYNLDTYEDIDLTPMSKSEKRKAKFSEEAEVIRDAEALSLIDFISS